MWLLIPLVLVVGAIALSRASKFPAPATQAVTITLHPGDAIDAGSVKAGGAVDVLSDTVPPIQFVNDTLGALRFDEPVQTQASAGASFSAIGVGDTLITATFGDGSTATAKLHIG